MASKKSRAVWYVQERIKRNAEAKRKAREEWLRQKVYGRKGRGPKADGPSQSVRAVPSSFESNRRRH